MINVAAMANGMLRNMYPPRLDGPAKEKAPAATGADIGNETMCSIAQKGTKGNE